MGAITKPFIVTIGKLRCRFTPDAEHGGYSVVAVNRRGVYSQGDTFEEAVAMILDAERGMAEIHSEARHAPVAGKTRAKKDAKPGRRRPEPAGV